jgi:hypothetical protein
MRRSNNTLTAGSRSSWVQRVDSALRMNVHFHILCLDGVYVRQHPDHHHRTLTFHSLPTPTREVTEHIARRIADGVDAILKKHGRCLDRRLSLGGTHMPHKITISP